MKMRILMAALAALVFLSSPALAVYSSAADDPLDVAIQKVGNTHPVPSSFIVCHGRGCLIRTRVHLSPAEWNAAAGLFPVTGAAAERKAIRIAIARLEKATGPKAGTADDKGGTFQDAFAPGQLDCVDEAMNTGVYLTMLQNAKLLRFYRVAGRAYRGYFLNGWPHHAVKIEDRKTGELYVVDSWFHDNGKPAEVVPYAQWKGGWRPAPDKRTAQHAQWQNRRSD